MDWSILTIWIERIHGVGITLLISEGLSVCLGSIEFSLSSCLFSFLLGLLSTQFSLFGGDSGVGILGFIECGISSLMLGSALGIVKIVLGLIEGSLQSSFLFLDLAFS